MNVKNERKSHKKNDMLETIKKRLYHLKLKGSTIIHALVMKFWGKFFENKQYYAENGQMNLETFLVKI